MFRYSLRYPNSLWMKKQDKLSKLIQILKEGYPDSSLMTQPPKFYKR